MTNFRCPECGYDAEHAGECTECKVAFVACCPVCKEIKDECTCTGDTPQTKGPGPH